MIAKVVIAVAILYLITFLVNRYIVYPNLEKRIDQLEQQVNKDLPEGEKIEINVK